MTLHPGINTLRISVANETLAAKLILPDDWSPARPAAIVVIAGSWTTVKEQMAARYAPLVASAGFASLTFDFRGFGESDGAPRDVESPSRKAEDLRAVAAWASEQGAPVGFLPICASAGYAAVAAVAADSPIASIAMVAPWLHDREIVEAMYGGAGDVAARCEAAERARNTFLRTGEVEYVPAASNTDPSAAMFWEGAALDYYLNPNRGAIPEWSGRFAVMAWTEWLAFDPIAIAARVRAPTAIITGDATATPQGAHRFAAAMGARHTVIEIHGRSQFDFYDDAATVTLAARAAIGHFRDTLSSSTTMGDE